MNIQQVPFPLSSQEKPRRSFRADIVSLARESMQPDEGIVASSPRNNIAIATEFRLP